MALLLVGLRLWKIYFQSTGYSESRTWHRLLIKHADAARKKRKMKAVDGNSVNPCQCASLVTDPAALLAVMAAYAPPTGLSSGRLESLLPRARGNPASVSLAEPLQHPGYYHVASPEVHLFLQTPSFMANLGYDEVSVAQATPNEYLVCRKRKRLAVEEGREDEQEPCEVAEGEPEYLRLSEGSACLSPGQDPWKALLPLALRRRIKGLAALAPPFEKRVRFEALTPATGTPPVASGSSTATAE